MCGEAGWPASSGHRLPGSNSLVLNHGARKGKLRFFIVAVLPFLILSISASISSQRNLVPLAHKAKSGALVIPAKVEEASTLPNKATLTLCNYA